MALKINILTLHGEFQGYFDVDEQGNVLGHLRDNDAEKSSSENEKFNMDDCCYMVDQPDMHEPMDEIKVTIEKDGQVYEKMFEIYPNTEEQVDVGPYTVTFTADFDHAWCYGEAYLTNHYDLNVRDIIYTNKPPKKECTCVCSCGN